MFTLNSDKLQLCHLFWCIYSYSCTYAFHVSSVFFTILKTVSKVKENDVLVRNFAFLKSFSNWGFNFFICLKNDCSNFKAVNFFSLSPTHINTQSPLSAHGYFFPLPQPFFHIQKPSAFCMWKKTAKISYSKKNKFHSAP